MIKNLLITIIVLGIIFSCLLAFVFFNFCRSSQYYYVGRKTLEDFVSSLQFGNYRGALPSLTEAIKYDRKFLFLRGWDEFIIGNYSDCVKDIENFLKETDKDPYIPYGIILDALAYREMKQPDLALGILRRYKSESDQWPGAVIKFLLGETTQEQVLIYARTSGLMVEAQAYLGIAALTNGKDTEGINMLKRAVECGDQLHKCDMEHIWLGNYSIASKRLMEILTQQMALSKLKEVETEH